MSIGEEERIQPDAGLIRGHRKHMLSELQFAVARDGLDRGEVRGEAEVTPYMHVPGTSHLRTSILAVWADMLSGILTLYAVQPRVSVTLELDVHLYRPAPASGIVRAEGRVVKAGRSVIVSHVEFTDSQREPFGFSTSSFMASPDASFTVPSLKASMRFINNAPRLAVPFADRAGLIRRAVPGEAELAVSDDGRNSTNSMHGGLIALAAEESVLSLADDPGATVCSLQVRYLSAIRVGPAVATASGRHGLFGCEIHDRGKENRLAAVATARTF